MFQHKISSKLPILLIFVIVHQRTPNVAASSAVQHKNVPLPQQQQMHNIQQAQQHHQQQQQHQLHQSQYLQEKDSLQDSSKVDHLSNRNADDNVGDPFIFNDLKQEPRLPTPTSASNFFPWNWFSQFSPYTLQKNSPPQAPHPFDSMTPTIPTQKYLPFFGYPQPIFIPFPLFITPDMLYPSATTNYANTNDIEESMSRSADGRRSSSGNLGNSGYQRNSPIYYMRLPPSSPFMFLSGLGFPATPLSHPQSLRGSFVTGFSPVMPYNALPTISAYSSIFNPPVNFLANGKPTNIYQMSEPPNDVQQNSLQYTEVSGFGPRPQASNPFRPTSSFSQSNANYLPQSPYGAVPPFPQDSKLTALKRPFMFNGRPEEIYILPNNFNPFSETSLSDFY